MSPTDSLGRAVNPIGMLREITAAHRQRAAQLVREGRVFDLSHTLHQHIPAFEGRSFQQRLLTSAHQVNRRRPDAGIAGWGENNLNWVIETVTATSQMGTHLDGLNHLQKGERFYGGYTLAEIAEEWGTNQLGIQTVPQIVTRGILVNMAACRKVERLDKGEVIKVAEVEACLEAAGLEIGRGDALFFHTGWGDFWETDNATYLSGEPGPGMELAHWMVQKGVVLSGCDTWSYGAVPPENPARPFEVPQMLNVEHGLFIVENLFTAELAQQGMATEFMLVLSHPKVRGATGAWVAPVAIL